MRGPLCIAPQFSNLYITKYSQGVRIWRCLQRPLCLCSTLCPELRCVPWRSCIERGALALPSCHRRPNGGGGGCTTRSISPCNCHFLSIRRGIPQETLCQRAPLLFLHCEATLRQSLSETNETPRKGSSLHVEPRSNLKSTRYNLFVTCVMPYTSVVSSPFFSLPPGTALPCSKLQDRQCIPVA